MDTKLTIVGLQEIYGFAARAGRTCARVARGARFLSVTRTARELSLSVKKQLVPVHVHPRGTGADGD